MAASVRLPAQKHDLLTKLVLSDGVLAQQAPTARADEGAERGRAREHVREAVRRVDGAPRGMRGDALRVWRGLMDGSWSIVDRHDHDGRRYIVATPREPSEDCAEALSRREAEVAALAAEGYTDKWIGYALGLSRSTVSTHLRAALQKLRLTSRVGLSRAFRMAAREAGDEFCVPDP